MDATPIRPESDVRRRIIDAASTLFYTRGVRAVSADRLIAQSGVSKMTFYRHFPSKDDVVVAYLDRLSALERERFDDARSRLDDASLWDWFVDAVAEAGCETGFRGCPFINAAAEYAEPDHVVRRAVARHRQWFQDELAELAARLGADEPRVVAREIQMMRDGALVLAALDDGSDQIRRVLHDAGRRLLAAPQQG